MHAYQALCCDCPECGQEKVAFLAYSFHRKSVSLPTFHGITCSRCFHEYHQSIHEMALATEDPGGN